MSSLADRLAVSMIETRPHEGSPAMTAESEMQTVAGQYDMTMPNVIGIGFERSATTSLHYSLSRHPEVLVSSRKEPNFWLFDAAGTPPATMPSMQVDLMAKRSGRTRQAYEALFDGATEQHKAIAEFSPSYLRFPHDVAPRLAAELPDAKLIVIVRQPVDHARSLLAVWLGRAPTADDLSDALRQNMPAPCGRPGLTDHGQYADWLRPYFDLFPRDQIKVLLFDRLEVDLLDDVQRFLELTPLPLSVRHDNASGGPRVGALNRLVRLTGGALKERLPDHVLRRLMPMWQRVRSANVRASEPLPPEIRIDLTERFYGRSIQQLEDLAGIDLRPWRVPEMKARAEEPVWRPVELVE